MKKGLHSIWKTLGSIACAVAVFSVYTGHPHCLLIIHQPEVPKELKQKLNAMEKNDEDFNL